MDNQPKTIGELFQAMFAAIDRIEQKIEFILETIEMSGDFDDADINPFGRERDNNETL